MIGCVNQAEPVSSNLYITSLKDFSIILCNLKREQNITTLYFTITKMSEGEPDFILQIPKVKEEHERQLIKIPITLTDDHENRYNGKLQIDLGYKYGGESIINYFPKGFTYVGTAKIWMPKIAPIEKLKIGDKEIPFEKAKFTKPQFMENFGDFTGIKSQKIQVGKWLSFTIGEKITPAGGSWEIPLIIENEDYNPLSIQMIFGTQLYDGRICWYDSSGYRKNAKGLSKFSDEIQIVNAQYYGYTEEFVHPIACLVMGINESFGWSGNKRDAGDISPGLQS